jgi:alkylation response protein AidB-like acyl-CoA dehydrogenase
VVTHLVDRYGERTGALTSHEHQPEERRHMVLAVRQLVDKDVAPVAREHEQAGRSARVVLAGLADLGILAATLPLDDGGLGLPPAACALLLEEIARGLAALAAVVASHVTAARALALHGGLEGGGARLGPLGRGELRAATALAGGVSLRRDGGDVVLAGQTAVTEGAAGADLLVVAASADGRRALVAVPAVTPGVRIGAAEPTLGLRGAEAARVAFTDARLRASALLPDAALDDTLGFAHLGAAAIGVGLAQAAFEAALRYSQQRSAFGKPISQHQAIQLKLADMATAVTAARLLVTDAGADPDRAVGAKLQAAATAMRVSLESMRTHGGYGYTTEFPVERYYRDAARLLHTPVPEDTARAEAAARLRAGDLH